MIDDSNTIENLLTYKGLEPLEEALKELKLIQELDVKSFTEADVREEIINPMLRILGYRKGQYFSVDREKHLSFVGKTSKFIDYNLTLWKENFWIIEAKKPLKGEHFKYKELIQAVEYSIHPKINAAIVVLCDGIKLEVFDREENLEEAILSFKIVDLLDNFNKLRNLVAPMQVWFFYKRRVLRSIDKAFENEFNLNRVEEFRDLIENKFLKIRGKVLKNFQSMEFKDSYNQNIFSTASIEDIIGAHFFSIHSITIMKIMNKVLINDCKKRGDFNVIYRIFPDEYRDINEAYIVNSLFFLIKLEEEVPKINWAPSWLDGKHNVEISVLIKKLIKLSLNYFQEDEARKLILLSSLAYKRIFKILSLVRPEQQEMAQKQHLFNRYNLSEFSWNQILSSENRNILINIDIQSIMAVSKFVDKHKEKNCKFNVNLAKQELVKLWQIEEFLLKENPNYKQLNNEKDLGEMHPTEYCGISYDNLGHTILAIIKDEEKWCDYVLKNHLEELQELCATGSWSAKDILNKANIKLSKTKEDINLSEKFFCGNDTLFKSLKKIYTYI
ncbi:hypothetical protein [Aliarcobacter butzleri]|uniref:hypothetical protein n=1 Tax=Aliarcobacter butzleri TaxID=28197 RepID=UPI002B24B9C2|nr:hypothetical protein [Aliarcobacter butzleri]